MILTTRNGCGDRYWRVRKNRVLASEHAVHGFQQVEPHWPAVEAGTVSTAGRHSSPLLSLWSWSAAARGESRGRIEWSRPSRPSSWTGAPSRLPAIATARARAGEVPLCHCHSHHSFPRNRIAAAKSLYYWTPPLPVRARARARGHPCPCPCWVLSVSECVRAILSTAARIAAAAAVDCCARAASASSITDWHAVI